MNGHIWMYSCILHRLVCLYSNVTGDTRSLIPGYIRICHHVAVAKAELCCKLTADMRSVMFLMKVLFPPETRYCVFWIWQVPFSYSEYVTSNFVKAIVCRPSIDVASRFSTVNMSQLTGSMMRNCWCTTCWLMLVGILCRMF